MTQDLLAKLLRIAAAAATVGLAACVHRAAEDLPLGQIMAVRAGLSMGLLILYGLLTGAPRDLLPRAYRPHLVRGAIACVAMVLTYIAFARLPVTQAQTLLYLTPILLIPVALLRLGERPTLRIGLSLVLGFTGVLLVLGLTFDAGSTLFFGALSGIAAAALIAVIHVNVRAMTATETAISIALSFTVIVTAVMGLTVFSGTWVWPEGGALYALLGAGVLGAVNLMCLAEALSRAPASTLAPLDYTGLIWALLIDWLIFSQIPGAVGILGAVLITVAAFITVRAPKPVAG